MFAILAALFVVEIAVDDELIPAGVEQWHYIELDFVLGDPGVFVTKAMVIALDCPQESHGFSLCRYSKKLPGDCPLVVGDSPMPFLFDWEQV